jgi:hypothetical protein
MYITCHVLYSQIQHVLLIESHIIICEKASPDLAVRPAHTVYLCVSCGSHNKQRLFP